MINEADAVRTTDETTMVRPANEPWDPYDVWLKRVKRPRDEAPTPAVRSLLVSPAQRTHGIVRRRASVTS